MRSRPFRVCAAQTDPVLGGTAENAERVASEVAAAAEEGAELVVFPEAALTGYLFASRSEALDGAVTVDGPELARVREACRDAEVRVVCGAVEREDATGDDGGPGLHNTAFLVGPGGLEGRYRKVHTLCLGVDRFTRPGERFPVFSLPFVRLGMHICYDGSFCEPARALRLRGAQLLVLPTNWPSLAVKEALVRVRAYENYVFYLAVNRVGTERGVEFRGGSRMAGPLGELLLEADEGPGRWHAEVDPARTADSRVVERPGEYEFDRLADRRPDRYGTLVEPVPEEGRTGSRRAGESLPAAPEPSA